MNQSNAVVESTVDITVDVGTRDSILVFNFSKLPPSKYTDVRNTCVGRDDGPCETWPAAKAAIAYGLSQNFLFARRYMSSLCYGHDHFELVVLLRNEACRPSRKEVIEEIRDFLSPAGVTLSASPAVTAA